MAILLVTGIVRLERTLRCAIQHKWATWMWIQGYHHLVNILINNIYVKCLMYRWVQLEILHWWCKHALGQIPKDVVAWALTDMWAWNNDKAHSFASTVSPFNHITEFSQVLFHLVGVLLELFLVSILCIVKRWYRSIVAKREMLVVEISLYISIVSPHMTIGVCRNALL